MLGYDVSWAAFNIVEVMSSSKFTYKVRNYKINIFSTYIKSRGSHMITFLFLFSENRLPCSFTMLSWGHRCHNADNQSDSQGEFAPSCSHGEPYIFIFGCTDWYTLYSQQDLSSPNQYDTGVALTGLSCFVTPDLARDLANDIMTLVNRLYRGALKNCKQSFKPISIQIVYYWQILTRRT